MYFFRTFKKSTAQYKVHNMGLRYIKGQYRLFEDPDYKALKDMTSVLQ